MKDFCTSVITLDKAALWTGRRTFQSAIGDIDCAWTIYRKGTRTGQPAQPFKNTSKTCIKTLRWKCHNCVYVKKSEKSKKVIKSKFMQYIHVLGTVFD